MRILFFGSPDFAVPSLEGLAEAPHQVAAVATRPDRPQGRGRATLPSAVKRAALRLGIPVLEPVRLRGEFTDTVRDLAPDILIVVAYGKVLPGELLRLPPRGAVNLHASLLPRHRGASPVQAAILAGDLRTGVTTMQMDEGLDTGPVLLAEEAEIGSEETAQSLAARLARRGARLLLETLRGLEAGTIEPRPQDPGLASYAPRIEASESRIDWGLDAPLLARRVRAFQPWPGAHTSLAEGGRLKLLRVAALAGPAGGEPGRVAVAREDRIEVACGEGRLAILEAQPEGKRALSARDLVNGRRIREGDRLGASWDERA